MGSSVSTSSELQDGDIGRRRHRLGGRRRRGSERAEPLILNFAPMIDVTFLLLIFFLVTTTFERAEGLLASDMPKTGGHTSVALPLSPIVVRLTQVGTGHDDFSIRLDNFTDQPASFVDLAGKLREIHRLPGFDTDTPLVIVAGNAVRWDHVVGCWNAALNAGCRRIAFAEP